MANPLREAVKNYFYPFAESKQFVRVKSKHPHFTTFRRVNGTAVHVFDVQWDKYGRPAFVINFGEASIDDSQVSSAEIEPEQCKVLCRLQPDKSSPRWWRLRKPWLEVLKTARLRYEPQEVVDQVIACFPDAEAWWTEKQEGAHVQVLWRAA
jgi:hypothetical protein